MSAGSLTRPPGSPQEGEGEGQRRPGADSGQALHSFTGWTRAAGNRENMTGLEMNHVGTFVNTQEIVFFFFVEFVTQNFLCVIHGAAELCGALVLYI